MKLEGKKAIVTGGSRGIGRAVTLAYAKEGADVLVNYHSNDAAAKDTVAEIEKLGRKGIAVQADVSDYKSAQNMVDECVKQLGGVDIVVNNAGVSRPSMLLKMKEEDWNYIIDVHLKAAFNTSQAAGRYMKEKKLWQDYKCHFHSRNFRHHRPDQLCFCQGRYHRFYQVSLP